MQQVHPIRRLFPRHTLSAALQAEIERGNQLPEEERKKLSYKYLEKGELALLRDHISAFSLFEAAAELGKDDPLLWYLQGIAFLEYGFERNREKAFSIASRFFKIATELAPDRVEAWFAWGYTLSQLGHCHQNSCFFLKAKEKYTKAIECCEHLPPSSQGLIHWECGLTWSYIAEHSGEAGDVQTAIQFLRSALRFMPTPSALFLRDFGNVHLQMGFLISDPTPYLQAIDCLTRAIEENKKDPESWHSLATAYTQLYLNTMNEHYSLRASECYAQLCDLSPESAEYWLEWGQLLGEAGYLNRDVKKLQQAVEKCTHARTLDAEQPLIICQWVESLSHLGKLAQRLDLLVEAEHKILNATDHFPEDPDLWHAYGICLINFGHYYSDPDYYECAIEKLQHGLSLDRTHAEIWHALALAHAHVANQTDDLNMISRANRFFARAIDLKPGCPSLLFDAANGHLLSFDLQENTKDLERALATYETLLQNHKNSILYHPEWLFQYATALEWLGDLEEEGNQFAKALDLYIHVSLIDPEMPKIYLRIAMCLVKLGEFSLDSEPYVRSQHYFRLAIRQDPEDDGVWLEWGLMLIHLAHHTLDLETMHQQYMDAEQKIIRAGQLGNLQTHYTLGCLYSIMGRCNEAIDFLCKAEAGGTLPTVEEILEDEWLDNLRNKERFTQFLSHLEAKQHRNGTAEF